MTLTRHAFLPLVLILSGCGTGVATAPQYPVSATVASVALAEGDCTVQPTERGIYSAIRGEDVYLVVYMSRTDWLSEADSLVLKINTSGPVEVDGVASRLGFSRSALKVAPGFVRVEFELAQVGATEHVDGSPSFWVRAETSGGCFLGSFFVPFGRGNR